MIASGVQAMIQVESTNRLEEIEGALARAAQRHGAHLVSVTPLGVLLGEEARRVQDALSFSVCHTELYAALLAADIRFAALLPCRIAAVRRPEGVTLESLPPRQFCDYLGRPDLEPLAAQLETLLGELMREAAQPAAHAHPLGRSPDAALGAHESQMSTRRPIPPRIDCHGTKVEDMAGTGKIDAPGG
jgi:uncharacterized protein (DUF302 family)